MRDDLTRGLPPDLVAILRDQSIVVPQDAAVFGLIAAWNHAPATTASAELSVSTSRDVVAALYETAHVASSTTPAACC